MHTSLEGSGCIRKMDVWPNVSGRYLVTDCVTRCLIRHFITIAFFPYASWAFQARMHTATNLLMPCQASCWYEWGRIAATAEDALPQRRTHCDGGGRGMPRPYCIEIFCSPISRIEIFCSSIFCNPIFCIGIFRSAIFRIAVLYCNILSNNIF